MLQEPANTEITEIDNASIQLLTNRRLSYYNCMNDRILMPIYESVITSPFSIMAVYDLYNIFKDNGWQVRKVTSKTQKEFVFGKYPGNNTVSISFWLTVEIQNNSPDKITSWLICPDKTPLIITLFVAKIDNADIKHYTGLINWDPTDPVPFTDTVKRHIQQLITVCTGIITQCNGTGVPRNSKPTPGEREFNVNGTCETSVFTGLSSSTILKDSWRLGGVSPAEDSSKIIITKS